MTTRPSDEELDILIRARLELVGIDLNELPAETNPATGTPSQATALASLRNFMAGRLVDGQRVGGTPPIVSAWQPPSHGGADEDRLAQQVAPPSMYPSILTAWTEPRR